MEPRDWCVVLLVAVAIAAVLSVSLAAAAEEVQKVLTLDHSNFWDIVSQHDFVLVQFYTPWCRFSKALAPEVGVFPKFSGEEFENFMALADELRSDYDFFHTLDAKLLPRGESVSKPTLRLLKPFDELFVDSQEFEVDAMGKFITESTIPIVTVWNNDSSTFPYPSKFFQSPGSLVMLFVDFNKEHDDFQAKYKNVATLYRGKGLNFMFGNADTTQNAFQYFGFKAEQAPVVILRHEDGQKFRKENVEPDHIESWVKDCLEGKVKPYIRSEPIPEVNNEAVKVVVRNSIQDIVFNSGKNVLIMFYAPWCGNSMKLAPILDEVAISFQKDPSVLVAKFDATVNDVPRDTFKVQEFPTLYVRSANGNLSRMYGGDRTTEDIINFVNIYRDKLARLSPSGKTSTPYVL